MNASLQRSLRLGLAAIAATTVIGGIVYYSMSGSSGETVSPQSNRPVPVQVVEARTAPIRNALTYSGAIEAAQQVSLAPRLAGQLASINVGVGTAVRVGDTLATLDAGTLPAQLQQAHAALLSAQARLDLMIAGPRSADIAAAEASLASVEANLRALLIPSPSDRSTAQSALSAAKNAVTNVEVGVDAARNTAGTALVNYCRTFNVAVVTCATPIPIPPTEVSQLQQILRTNELYAQTDGGGRAVVLLASNNAYLVAVNTLDSAKQALAAAEDRYGLLLSPPATAVAAQRAAVETARAALDNRRLPYTAADIAGSRAAVAAAQAGVAAASTSLSQTAVVAPFDGIIAQQLLDVGATVAPQTPIFVLIAKAVESHLTVDEARIGLLKPDMLAEVTVPAFPGRIFKGRISTIAPLAATRAHTFDVKVFAEDPEAVLRPGMFAEVTIIAATKPNAILVPTAAVVQQGTTSRVFVVTNGKAVAKQVKLGIADATNTEIVEGIAAGDQVIAVGQNSVRDGQAVIVSAAPVATPTTPAATKAP